jgi:hypothetical protein
MYDRWDARSNCVAWPEMCPDEIGGSNSAPFHSWKAHCGNERNMTSNSALERTVKHRGALCICESQGARLLNLVG